MTNFDTMEAGPELDALVAKRVMGHIYKEGEGVGKYQGEVVKGWGWPGHPWVNPDGLRKYSTDIAAAGEVIEKLNLLMFSVHRENCEGVRYDAECYDDPDQSDRVFATAPTAPLAICRAALKAAEVPDA